MVQRIGNHSVGVLLGILVGIVVSVGWFGLGQGIPVQATATHGEKNFAIATGFVDEEQEAFYFLDFLTGDLRAAVVSRRTGEFVAFFEKNILTDFSTLGKNPKFLMVTGLASIPRGKSPFQIGSSLIYIAEATSGEVSAYAIPWNPSLSAKGAPQTGTFVKLAGGSFRTAFVRDE
ncbi:hypothetical protein [Bythopirellula polymerisocia]|uniref:Uncharacterized protein n=1 Tax=Bythopirellula polymerisocia TaxID=2528003 RepID=A0A5C6CVC0_9BACT|nr:hypothetical protein [Bythopirellula polymerisocia]TWU27457.1 hypothetical protein Pla144_22300 [Bythopirellula polymerisocia]